MKGAKAEYVVDRLDAEGYEPDIIKEPRLESFIRSSRVDPQ